MSKKKKKNKEISKHTLIALGSSMVVGGLFAFSYASLNAKTTIYLAACDIPAYSRVIVSEDFVATEVPKSVAKTFDGFLTELSNIIGTIPTTDITQGQPVKASLFVNPESAFDISSVVTSKDNRAIYLTLTSEGALNGDVKVNGIYDFYIIATVPDETDTNKTQYKVIPFQSSYLVKKMVSYEDGSIDILFEFPKEESEEYVLLKQLIESGSIAIISTLPGQIVETYNGDIVLQNTFMGNLLDNKEYFTQMGNGSIKDESTSGSDTTITTNNDLTTNGPNTNSESSAPSQNAGAPEEVKDSE